jgi:hypothetical protein
MITCKLTGTKGPGVKAHIVPKAFYVLPPQNEGPMLLMSNKTGTFKKKLPIGIYDDSFVTKEGEKFFEKWDCYAVNILIKGWYNFEKIEVNGELVAWRLPEYNYSLLKLFALSVLWRAHCSNHNAFSRVHLGSHADVIRQMLLSNYPGKSEEYSVNIARWKTTDFDQIFMDPFSEKINGVIYYRIYCGLYILYVKVDKQSSYHEFKELQLGERKELILIARELLKSKEWPVMQSIVKQNIRSKQ